jgi:subtilisin family serine protease
MSAIFIILALFPRPDLVPVGAVELAAVRQIQAQIREPGRHRSAWDSPASDRVPGRFVVGYDPGCLGAAGDWVVQQGGNVVRVDQACGFMVASFPDGDMERDRTPAVSALRTPGIRFFEPSLRVSATVLPNDPYFLSSQWDKWAIYADQAWDVTGGSMGVKVAVVDVGVDWQHPDLAASFLPGELGYDFICNDSDPRPDSISLPDAFHGTHVAGIIAATRDNSEGIAGLSLVQLLSVRVLTDSGWGYTEDVASGIEWATDHGAKVINLSLGSSSPSDVMEMACKYAQQHGVTIVAASGNDGQKSIAYPAAYSECIAVGATKPDSRLARFSNYGPEQEVVAPGVEIMSCAPGAMYVQAEGTSMAAPQVSGVAALVLAVNNALTANEVRAILDASAVDLGDAGRDDKYGYGQVNAKRAVDLAVMHRPGRAPSAGVRQQHTTGPTFVLRSGSGLPSWLRQADVFDRTGRHVQTGKSGLRPGTYFVLASPKSKIQGPKSGPVRRLLVLD